MNPLGAELSMLAGLETNLTFPLDENGSAKAKIESVPVSVAVGVVPAAGSPPNNHDDVPDLAIHTLRAVASTATRRVVVEVPVRIPTLAPLVQHDDSVGQHSSASELRYACPVVALSDDPHTPAACTRPPELVRLEV